MTEKLFYKDAYMKEFDAEVLECKAADESHLEQKAENAAKDKADANSKKDKAADKKKDKSAANKDIFLIRLDRTAFYPEGGGQGADIGKLILPDGGEIRISDVQEAEGEIWHYADKAVPEGTKVHCVLDWDHRFDHMQQHSGEHIVSGMICSRFHCDNVGFHMSEEIVTIDYNTHISMEDAIGIENQANRYIWENHPFVEMWPSPEELEKIEYRSKKELSGEVRITCFPGADTCACCGVHVASSAEVGLVKFISAKNFREGTRLELYCGKRAMDYLAMNQKANKATAVLLSTREDKTPDVVAKLQAENMEMRNSLSMLEGKLFDLWADTVSGQEQVLVIDEQLEPEQGRRLADRLADKCSGIVAVMIKAGEGYRYSVIRRDGEVTDFVREMNASLNGRGGGRNGFAQGSVQATRKEIEKFFDR